MSEYVRYRRTAVAEMADWHEGFDMTGVSVSEADLDAGSPKPGDKIAHNPANHEDRWLVAAAYFAENFEELNSTTDRKRERVIELIREHVRGEVLWDDVRLGRLADAVVAALVPRPEIDREQIENALAPLGADSTTRPQAAAIVALLAESGWQDPRPTAPSREQMFDRIVDAIGERTGWTYPFEYARPYHHDDVLSSVKLQQVADAAVEAVMAWLDPDSEAPQ